jgi:hypothetical protein
MCVHNGPDRSWWTFLPDPVDQHIQGHGLPEIDGQNDQYDPPFGGTDVDDTARHTDFDRSDQTQLHCCPQQSVRREVSANLTQCLPLLMNVAGTAGARGGGQPSVARKAKGSIEKGKLMVRKFVITLIPALVCAGALAVAVPAQAAAATPTCDWVASYAGAWVPENRAANTVICNMVEGDVSAGVRQLQHDMNLCYGEHLVEDSDFGPATHAALIRTQQKAGTPQTASTGRIHGKPLNTSRSPAVPASAYRDSVTRLIIGGAGSCRGRRHRFRRGRAQFAGDAVRSSPATPCSTRRSSAAPVYFGAAATFHQLGL